MKLKLVWVGKTREDWIKNGSDEYLRRICRYTPLTVLEVKDDPYADQATGRMKEAERIMKHIPPNAYVILLDERGEQLSSPQFATLLRRQQDAGTPEVVFAIGGAYGFAPFLYERAQQRIALSAMTFTHQMVRPIFLEQLYRAFTILNGEPYHH